MYIISDGDGEYSNSLYSEEIESKTNSEKQSIYHENDYESSDENLIDGENEIEVFLYVCTALIDDAEILVKSSFFDRDLDISADYIIKKILVATKKKINNCNKKILNWDNRTIYFIIFLYEEDAQKFKQML
ncbi:SNARE protein [Plasmodium yoelii yoelii]|uniref:SNARE protein n=1 Tax=Plasmodium yoelii yoelii TaxID=73239 RepID=A0AAE9WMB9_PLAYO|nr:SNARE protein [Plasmodium yoelii yoelii]